MTFHCAIPELVIMHTLAFYYSLIKINNGRPILQRILVMSKP